MFLWSIAFTVLLGVIIINADLRSRQVLIVAGNFSLNGQLVNIAAYDLQNLEWITSNAVDLYLYGAANGMILDIAVNQSNTQFNDVFAVGAFDSVSELSQIQYCSVGQWDGLLFNKVGEGLCPRGLESSATVRAQTVVLGNNGDIYVGGSFYSREWDGTNFVDLKYVAQFNGGRNQWSPLWGGLLNCSACATPSVAAMAWDSVNEVLYIGGDFDSIDATPISSGLCMWTNKLGLHGLPCLTGDDDKCTGPEGSSVGVRQSSEGPSGIVVGLAFDEPSQSLFVAGDFQSVRELTCGAVAVWNRIRNQWTCLNQDLRAIGIVTSIHFDRPYLYLAGWASYTSDWGQYSPFPYAISKLDASKYLAQMDLSVESTVRRTRFDGFMAMVTANDSQAVIPEVPWLPSWNWLPGFIGTNGPILRMASGTTSDSLFIVGAFNNMPSVLLWMNSTTSSGMSSVGSSSNSPVYVYAVQGKTTTLQGLVSAVAVANIGVEYIPPIPAPPTPQLRYSARMVVASAVVIFCVVAVSAICCSSPFVITVLPRDRSGNSAGIGGAEEATMLIPLGALEGGNSVNVGGIDFKKCFEQAMRARELPLVGNSLLMINPSEMLLVRVIGEGSFGRVWSGQWRNNNVAVKEFVFAQAAVIGGSVEKYKLIQEIVGEAGIMSCMHHPKILQLYGCSLTVQAIWIVTELCTHGSLRMVLDDQQIQLSHVQKLSISLDIADGMMYMHGRTPAIIHRDLKSHNIFVTGSSNNRYTAKIGDWGSAKAIALSGTKSMTHGVGTACWLAPEVITQTRFSKESDVYAFGIVLWEIYTRQEVYEKLSAAQIISKVAYEQLRPIVPPACPWRSLMVQCWSQASADRPSFARILSSLSELYSDVKKGGTNTAHDIRGLTSSTSVPSSYPPGSQFHGLLHDVEAGGSSSYNSSYASNRDYSSKQPETSSLFQAQKVLSGKEVFRNPPSLKSPGPAASSSSSAFRAGTPNSEGYLEYSPMTPGRISLLTSKHILRAASGDEEIEPLNKSNSLETPNSQLIVSTTESSPFEHFSSRQVSNESEGSGDADFRVNYSESCGDEGGYDTT